MGFFSNIFHLGKRKESVVLIDIGATSVAGAYVHYKEGELPVLVYARRFPIEVKENETRERALFRSLEMLGDMLSTEGTAALARATKRRHVRTVFIAIDAPWSETQVHLERIDKGHDFIFTKHTIAEVAKKVSVSSSEKLCANTSVIGTILNGYETKQPFNRRVNHASVIILNSLIRKDVSDVITKYLRRRFHTWHSVVMAGNSLRYQSVQLAFPHESEALILDATSLLPSVALIHKGLLVAVSDKLEGVTEKSSKTEQMNSAFTAVAKYYALPRIIFLLAQDGDMDEMHRALTGMRFGTLWLSDTPPKIVPLLSTNLKGLVRQLTTASAGLTLFLMALYYDQRLR